MRFYFLVIFLTVWGAFLCQVKINFKFNTKPLVRGEKYFINSDSIWIQVDELKFYVNYKPVFSDENRTDPLVIHLVDLSDSLSYFLPFTEEGMKNSKNFDFAIGLDSVSTSSTKFSGALDPALGMYWAWNTGYIHFKLEGKSNLCSSKNQEFLYHIGGYFGKYSTQRWLQSRIILINELAFIELELANFIKDGVNLGVNPVVMNPGKEAVFTADNYYRLFKQ